MPLSKDDVRRVNINIETLEAALEKEPGATHVYVRRPDGVAVDLPLNTAVATLKSHPDWKVEHVAASDIPQGKQNLASHNPDATASDRTMTNEERQAARQSDGSLVPPKPSEREDKPEFEEKTQAKPKKSILGGKKK